MNSYPYLSLEQQKKLPALIQANALSMMFDDSTHQLWKCETSQGQIILKICNSYNVAKSTFWQGMQSLFDVDIPNQLAEFEQVFQTVTSLSPLTIPNYIASGSAAQNEQAFIAVSHLAGEMVKKDAVDDEMVVSLAHHIAKLHQATQSTWGRIGHVNLNAQQWSQRLQDTLKQLAVTQEVTIPDAILNEALQQAKNCTPDDFVPMMPDLRWDQFLQQDGKLTALIDLDAFVVGPRELELVLFEYLLTEQQAKVFSKHYQQIHSFPDLTQVRKPYRLLLFMMNVLGEKDVDIWMRASTRF